MKFINPRENSLFRFRKRGTSLVEVVLSIGLFSFVFLLLLGLLPAGLKTNQLSETEGNAVLLLDAIVQDLKKAHQSNASPNLGIKPLPSSLTIGQTQEYPLDEVGEMVAASSASYDLSIKLVDGPTALKPDLPHELYLILSWPNGAVKPVGVVETFVIIPNK